ncbi:MAG TPA: hypothetical protein VEN29_13790 [Casimicrobiaceae bacterium]|nr:hypothetical protein [Casimicrobiaceae bacterium]
MPEASGQAEIVHLGWRANGDGFDVALAVNRLLSCGARVWWIQESHDAVDAGDYLVEVTHAQRLGLSRLGVSIAPWHANIPSDARLLSRPVVRLFAGTASKFPYFAYYALCLLRLGIDYAGCDGALLAHGALADANLLILPGGFATWGIDRAEDASGADERVRDFLARGGAAIGSCGGAYYLSAGRPGWTGTAPAKPLYTHEYLQSGVGVVSIAMRPGPLSFGCPPTMEVPYYHGPIYDLLGSGIEVAATFHALALPGRLAIDNPLDREAFERDIAGKPAILMVAGNRGRAVLFSPHPEMGDLVRRYIALDGYVRRYLPIRGFGTMRDTLRHYRVTDAPSFRLVVNAVHALMTDTQSPRDASPARGIEPESEHMTNECVDALPTLCRRALAKLPDFGGGEEGDLLHDVAAGIAARLDAASARAADLMKRAELIPSLEPSRRHLAYAMTEHWKDGANRTAPQQLMEADLGVALLECWTRAAEFDLAIAGT